MTSNAASRSRMRAACGWSAMSSRKLRRTQKSRPPSDTVASPSRWIVPWASRSRCATCEGLAGAPIVATARTSGTRWRAARTAAPPREWPMSRLGAAYCVRRKSAAATRSCTFELKPVLPKSPPDWPRPVKSKRRTAMPWSVSARAVREAARPSLLQVKQWAKIAYARGAVPAGSSRRAARTAPSPPGKVTLSEVDMCSSIPDRAVPCRIPLLPLFSHALLTSSLHATPRRV